MPTELPTLTGLRGFAAFWVLLYHVWVEAGPRLMTIGSGRYSIDMTPAFSGGWAGVDIFFTLSAFLLSLPFVSWQLGLTRRPSLRTFWLRRVLRIFPAYYAQIAVLLILAGCFGAGAWPGFTQLLGNLLLWFNFGSVGVAPLNAVAYTLPIEFCFYLLLPLLACLLRPRWWVLLLVVAVLETQLYRHLMFAAIGDVDTPHKVVALEQLPGRIDQFAFGMLAAYAYGRAAIAGRLPDMRTNDALLVLGAAGVALMLTLIHFGIGTYWEGSWLLFIWHGAVGAAVGLMLFACAAGSRIANALLSNRPLHYLGVISFGVYLWHYPLIHWLSATHAFDWISGYRLPWILPIVLLLSCLIADVSYRLIERPLLRLGRRRNQHPGVTTEGVPVALTANP
ncbi:acyltransferase [Dokdonella soli]|uniref:Acyltransferase 3 domain-containing protein n=1 Tax=Dokdonella soli TaxID=529810 RepID=A0ABN1IWF2_9GAMM